MRFLLPEMRIIVAILFSVSLLSTIKAQEIKVYSASTNQPIVGVAVFNELKTLTVVSDFDGKVDISDFSEEEVLYFSHISHIAQKIKKRTLLESGTILFMEIDKNQLSEVVISVSKWEQHKKDISQKVVSITSDDIELFTPQTSADLLQNSGAVYIQKSQLGGGSPMIRGFSTNRLLITVDGVRMNTAIFRGGNVQNVISIDPFVVDRTEVILGPGSVVYGSDAIGGVMNFYTAQPRFGMKGKQKLSGDALVRYATASNEKTGHIDLNYGLQDWAFYSSLSYTDFDDLKMGSHGPEAYLRENYVISNGGRDTIVQNNNPEKQIGTGYNQINVMQKIHHTPNERVDISASLLYSTTSDYPRYDRLIRPGNEGLRSAEWYYGPQEWLMTNLQLVNKWDNIFYDKMKVLGAYQLFKESRNDRNFQSAVLESTKEKVDAYSISVDFEKTYLKNAVFYYGLEYILNQVQSNGQTLNIDTGQIETSQSRYPDGATWQSIAAYVSTKYELNDQLTFQGGLRYNRIILYSQYDDRFFDFPFEEANLDTDAVTGTAGISWLPSDFIQWKLNFSTAFRAPNIDDVGKIFDSEPGAVVVPNSNLVPEYAYSGELGCTIAFTKKVSLDLAAYYTRLKNALVRRNFQFNGEDEIDFGGQRSQVQAIQNAAQGTIYGFEAGLKADFTENINLISRYTFTGGDEELDDGSVAPARHVAPQFGQTRLQYNKKQWFLEAFAMYNGRFDFNDLAPSEKNKPYIYASDNNNNPYSPSWYTLNVRSKYQISEALQGILTLENITDQRYRAYSSGIAGPGRNFIASLKYSF